MPLFLHQQDTMQRRAGHEGVGAPGASTDAPAIRDAVSVRSRMSSLKCAGSLADALSQGDAPVADVSWPNRLEDFTYFVRFEEDGRLIWEGDLQCPYYNEDDVVLDLGLVWDAIRRRARSWIGNGAHASTS